jgi:hypothetical protein
MTTWYGWPLSRIRADSRPVAGDPAGSRGTFGSTPMSTSAGSSNASVSRITGGPCPDRRPARGSHRAGPPAPRSRRRPGRAHAGPGIAEQHLLPRDLAQRVVVDDDLHRQAGAQTRHEPVAAAAGQPEGHIDPQLACPPAPPERSSPPARLRDQDQTRSSRHGRSPGYPPRTPANTARGNVINLPDFEIAGDVLPLGSNDQAPASGISNQGALRITAYPLSPFAAY